MIKAWPDPWSPGGLRLRPSTGFRCIQCGQTRVTWPWLRDLRGWMTYVLLCQIFQAGIRWCLLWWFAVLWNQHSFFPTCQVRVVRFYVRLLASSFLPPSSFLTPSSAPRRTSTASSIDRSVPPHRTPIATSRSQCSPLGLHRRASTASSGSECSPPDLNCELRIRVFPARPQPQRIPEDIPDRMPEKNVR